jgi:F0F1-type ATP synthase alpha subunit
MRVDLLRPLTKGNLILLKGERNTGKTQVAADIISNFIAEGADNRVVYVGMSAKGRDVQTRVASDQLMTIGVDDESQAAFLLAPQVALKVAQ